MWALHKESSQIVVRLGADDPVLHPTTAGLTSFPNLECVYQGRLCFVPAIPRSALLSVIWTPPPLTNPHPLDLHFPGVSVLQVKPFVTSMKYRKRLLRPVLVDLELRYEFRLFPLRSRFWFIKKFSPKVQHFVHPDCQAIETERH